MFGEFKISNEMLKFVVRDRQTPPKRPEDERRKDFDEIYEPFAEDAARDQSTRCSQCGVPFCSHHCPLGNNIPDWLKLAGEGQLEAAYEASSATNNMPEICGRICPQDRLCEGSCVIEQSGHGTVTIGAIEQYITETAWDSGWIKPIQNQKELDLSVGIIGAGPAGLAAAEELRKSGIQVTVYDRYDRPGGLLIYGIPNFKLEKDVVRRRTDHLAKSGVNYVLNFTVGEDASLDDLRAKHDAVLIATGVYKSRELTCPVSNDARVAPALDFLVSSNRRGLGDKDFENAALSEDLKGQSVAVIGGGDTAMDCVRTAVRQGASRVFCLYRRDRENMPGSNREVTNAEEEGVQFDWLSLPKSISNIDNKQTQIRVVQMMLGERDASGRRQPVPSEADDRDLQVDLVIKALGFEPEDIPTLFGAPDLKLSKYKTIRAHPISLQTNLSRVYAAGDIVRGASLVVWAIKDGRDAANAIINDLVPARARTPAFG